MPEVRPHPGAHTQDRDPQPFSLEHPSHIGDQCDDDWDDAEQDEGRQDAHTQRNDEGDAQSCSRQLAAAMLAAAQIGRQPAQQRGERNAGAAAEVDESDDRVQTLINVGQLRDNGPGRIVARHAGRPVRYRMDVPGLSVFGRLPERDRMAQPAETTAVLSLIHI